MLRPEMLLLLPLVAVILGIMLWGDAVRRRAYTLLGDPERIDALVFRMDNGAGVPFAQREKKKLEGLYSSYLFQREREDALL